MELLIGVGFVRKLTLICLIPCLVVVVFLYSNANYSRSVEVLISRNAAWLTYAPKEFPSTPNNSTLHYLVSNAKCKIPDLDPFNAQARRYFSSELYTKCRNTANLLTHVHKTGSEILVKIDQNSLPAYTVGLKNKQLLCCYSNASRMVVDKAERANKDIDSKLSISKCMPFKWQFSMQPDQVVIVKCKSSSSKLVYENAHVAISEHSRKFANKLRITVQDDNNTANANKNTQNNQRPISIIMVGIDSISRLNFIRAMPYTHNFVQETGWIPLLGYNKIGDNTFPNLMAILTGLSDTKLYELCSPTQLGKLDKCPLIWNEFRSAGYVTSYGEDHTDIGTFNYHKTGFVQPPTDVYYRPYLLAAEKLRIKRKESLIYCTGPESSGERIMNMALDFGRTFSATFASFGLFWTNTFSHNNINTPSGMDLKVRHFLYELQQSKVLENNIVVLFSDHGIRFGEIRFTMTGWLEERLPFFYISVPTWFKVSSTYLWLLTTATPP